MGVTQAAAGLKAGVGLEDSGGWLRGRGVQRSSNSRGCLGGGFSVRLGLPVNEWIPPPREGFARKSHPRLVWERTAGASPNTLVTGLRWCRPEGARGSSWGGPRQGKAKQEPVGRRGGCARLPRSSWCHAPCRIDEPWIARRSRLQADGSRLREPQRGGRGERSALTPASRWFPVARASERRNGRDVGGRGSWPTRRTCGTH